MLFLETTVQAGRITFAHETRKAIGRTIDGYKLLSSTYVMGEFKQTFLHDAVFLHKLVSDSSSPQVALNRAERYQNRTKDRMLRIFVQITEGHLADKRYVLSVLERYIEWQFIDRFMKDLHSIVNQTGCERAGVQPVKAGGVYDFPIKCQKASPPNCQIQEFLATHKKKLKLVIDGVSLLDEESQEKLESLRAILAGGLPFGNTCKDIADLIIALEVPEGAALATTNTRHFAPLAQILGGPELLDPVPRY